MKKILLILICILPCLALTACHNKTPEQPDTQLTYDITLRLEGDTLTGEQTTTFVNTFCDELTEAPFHLFANAYNEGAEHKAYGGILSSYGGIDVTDVTVNGVAVTPTLDDDRQYLTVPLSSALGEKVTVTFSYVVTVPESRMRFGKHGSGYYLTSFYPQLSVYNGDGFLTDPFTLVGDPLYSEIGDYTVSLTCPSSFVVACGAKKESKTDEGELSTYRFSASNVRDFALAASPDFSVLSASQEGTDLYYFYLTDDNSEQHFKTVCSAFSTFTNTFGSSDLAVYSVVYAPFDFSGMEFSGMAFVSCFAGEETTDVLLHETAHQWWYNLVGNDPIRESVLDEGLTSFTSAYYYLLTGDKATFDSQINDVKKVYAYYETLQKRRNTGVSLRMDGTLYDYTSYQYTMLMYYKGCLMFNNLLELYGAEKLNTCLICYAKKYAHKTATLSDFIAICSDVLKTDVSGLIAGWMGDGSTFTSLETSKID